DEIAGAEAVVELMYEDALPRVTAGARRPRQGEQIGAARDTGRRAALDRRGADFLIALPAEQLAEAGDLLLVKPLESLRRHVAAGDAGAARRDDDIDLRIGDPRPKLRDDLVELVADDLARGDAVAGLFRHLGQGIAGAVVGHAAGVRHGQQGDVDRQKR